MTSEAESPTLAVDSQPSGAANATERHSQPPALEAGPPHGLRNALLVGLAVCSLAALACWLQWRSLHSARSVHAARVQALDRMQVDSERIRSLQSTPKRAVERERPNEELLTQVESALQAANVPTQRWHDSIPQTPQRLPHSPYLRFSTRLYFEAVTLEQIMRFAHALLKADPSLTVSSLQVSSRPQQETAVWNVDLAVSYLVYAPGETG